MKIQNLQQKNGLLLIMKQKVIIHTIIQQNFLTKSVESSLCDYSDAYILVTVNFTATPSNAITQVVFTSCVPFKDFRTEINDTFVDYADVINITMPMYNLIAYSDNYSNTSGSLWNFKRDEIIHNAYVTNDDNAP